MSIEQVQKRALEILVEQGHDSPEYEKIIRDISPNPSDFFRGIVAGTRKFTLGKPEINVTWDKNASRKSLEGKTVFYTPNHQSNFDSAIVGLALHDNNYEFPVFAAGANLMTNKTTENILKKLSAMKFPRRPGGHQLRAITALEQAMMENGYASLVFPEGTRSRTGELLPFKPGVLMSAFEALENSNILEDVLFVPVSVQYTTIPDDNYLVNSKDAKAQKKSLIKNWHEMKGSMKNNPVYVHLGNPSSGAEYLEEIEHDINKVRVSEFGDRLRSAVAYDLPIIGEHLVYRILVDNNESMSESKLEKSFDKLTTQLLNSGTKVETSDFDILIQNMLYSGKISVNGGYTPTDANLAQFYANKTNHVLDRITH